MKLSAILIPLEGTLIGPDTTFKSVSIDSRSINSGDLFVALTGPNHDGHDYLSQAAEQGASAALVTREVDSPLAQVVVKDTEKALWNLAEWYRQGFNLPIAAVTGSNGKTTVKEMIAAIMRKEGDTMATQGNLNNHLGVPLMIMRLNTMHKFAVLEIGANAPGEVSALSRLVKPKVALINNVASAHIEGFGSVEGVAAAKSEIFEGLDKDGIAVINADDEFADFCRAKVNGQKIVSFGLQNTADVTAKNLQVNASGNSSYEIKTPQGNVSITLKLSGEHNVKNSLAATSAALALGATLENVKAGLESFKPVPGRLVKQEGPIGVQIIDDTYNANPSSVTAALYVLAQYPGERVMVLGDMAELGENAAEYHFQVGEQAKKLGIESLFTCGPLSKSASEGFGPGGVHFKEQAELITTLVKQLTENMTVLVKGSRSARMEKVVAGLLKETN